MSALAVRCVQRCGRGLRADALSALRHPLHHPALRQRLRPATDPFGEAGVVAIFASAMLRGQRPVIFGDGSHERDYVYVDDVVQANVLALARSLEQDEDALYNIGPGRERRSRRCSPRSPGPPTTAAARSTRLRVRATCIASTWTFAARSGELGWRAVVPLNEGIRRTVDAMRQAEVEAV